MYSLVHRDIPSQVQALIKAIREDTVHENRVRFKNELHLAICLFLIISFGTCAPQEVNFENDWKLVTIFIGGNDLCNYCFDQVSVPQNYCIVHKQQFTMEQ